MAVERGNTSDLTQRLDDIYSFISELYPLNWKLRFGGSSYMQSSIQQEEMDNFLGNQRKFESVAGHTCMTLIYHQLLIDNFPNLKRVLNQNRVCELILFHDLRETKRGDVSAVRQLVIDEGFKNDELFDLLKMANLLPPDLATKILDADKECEEPTTVEGLYVKMIDSLQAGHCILTLGDKFVENSVLIETIMRTRSILRAKKIVDCLKSESKWDDCKHYADAVRDVQMLVAYYIDTFRRKGAILDFSDLGF